MIMKKTKLICLLLVLVMVLGAFASCTGDGAGDSKDPGDRVDGSWEGVDFDGQTLVVEVSGAKDPQNTFPACNIYTRGPDSGTSTDEIQKKVLARNQKVKTELNIDVQYKKNSDCTYDTVLAHVEKYVLTSADDAPDVLDNDLYGLVRAMMKGYLWNVKDPGTDADGNELKSFLDFGYEGWYEEFMTGASYDANKLYLLAGDYHIDLVRFAWVFFTNIDKFNAAYGSTDFQSYDYMVEYIIGTGEFLYDDLMKLAELGWIDNGNVRNDTDLGDQIGLCLNNVCPRIFLACSGFSMVEWSGGSEGKGTPSVCLPTSEAANNLATLSRNYTTLFNSKGVHYIAEGVLESTTEFFSGNIIMTMSKLGEMESQDMRETDFKRGILPFPRYDRNSPNFVTVVHDQAEISVILSTTNNFTMASAYMQFLNEESADVLQEYYEKGLKFKYNDSKSVRTMIDYIKSNIRSPFDAVLVNYICGESAVKTQLYETFQSDATGGKNQFMSTYTQNQGSYADSLNAILTALARIE